MRYSFLNYFFSECFEVTVNGKLVFSYLNLEVKEFPNNSRVS